jgi:hypothetical protein
MAVLCRYCRINFKRNVFFMSGMIILIESDNQSVIITVYTEFLFSKLFVIFYLLIFYRSPITLAESV